MLVGPLAESVDPQLHSQGGIRQRTASEQYFQLFSLEGPMSSGVASGGQGAGR